MEKTKSEEILALLEGLSYQMALQILEGVKDDLRSVAIITPLSS